MATSKSFILTLSCLDKPGIVHTVTGVLAKSNLNIEESAQFHDPSTKRFFMRIQFAAAHGTSKMTSLPEIRDAFKDLGQTVQGSWQIYDVQDPPKVLLMVSKIGHCLNDILFRQSTGQLPIQIPLIVSNHPDYEKLAQSYNIPFYHIPVTKDTKAQAEAKVLELIKEHDVELVVLARYMQIMSPDFCDQAPPIINCHHSLLPAFIGAKPYHQAYDRGVKVIGATAHFATSGLDEGPIIEQDFSRATHTMSPKELTSIGSNIECVVLGRAIKWWAERRVLLNAHKTVIFS